MIPTSLMSGTANTPSVRHFSPNSVELSRTTLMSRCLRGMVVCTVDIQFRPVIKFCRLVLSSDGLAAYRLSVPFVLRDRVDYGQLVKNYASTQTATRYSPAQIISAEKKSRFGNPDHKRICTSHVERLNLSLRMHLRRFTRLTNGHSKSLKHHTAMQAIFFAWYNWCRKHETLGKNTPAMAAGLADKAWSIRELLEKAAVGVSQSD